MFMDNVDYGAWCAAITECLRADGIRDGLVCELGCGTGTMTERLAAAGFDMIGIDDSPEMLQEAAELSAVTARNQAKRIEALAQPIAILAVGSIVFLIVLSVALPMLDAMTAVSWQ